MATDNDNVIDIDGENKTERKSESKEGEKGKEGAEGGKKAKQKKTAIAVALGVFALIGLYLAYTYYKNNIAGSTGATAAPDDSDDGGGSAGGGGAPVVPPVVLPGSSAQLPVAVTTLAGAAPTEVAKVKAKAHKVTGHAAGPKITTPKTFVKTAQKLITLSPKTKTTPAVKVQKAVATPTNLDITKAIGSQEKDAQATAEEEANAHGHTANPIVHLVATPANLDVTKAKAAENVKAAPKVAAPKPAPKAPTHVGNTRKIA